MADSLQEFEDQLKQEELVRQVEEVGYDTSKYYQDADGTFYEFEESRRAWIPMINDDFIAQYNLNYGLYPDPTESSVVSSAPEAPVLPVPGASYATAPTEQLQQTDNEATTQSNEPTEKPKKRKPPPQEPEWFDIDDEKNTNVYVTGLPSDITDDEYLELMNKVGLVACDPITRKLKLKLYRNPDGSIKGDGRCCYIKPESVQLALTILDGSDVKGHKITVERAKFELKGQYDPTKKKRKLTKQEKKKAEEKQKWLLGWEPDKKADGRPHCDRVVVIKNAFTLQQLEESPTLLLELTEDFREECKKFGEIKKIVVCDRNKNGVVLVTYKTPEEADVCIQAINNRWFGGLKLEVASWDGRTKHYVKETPEEEKARLAKWAEFLEKKSTDKLAESSAEKKEAGEETTVESNVEMVTNESTPAKFVIGADDRDASELPTGVDRLEKTREKDSSKSLPVASSENSTDSDEDFDDDDDS